MYVHLLGSIGIIGVHFALLQIFRLDSGVQILVQDGPSDFLKTHSIRAVAYFTLYPIYVVVTSAALGAYGIPLKISSAIANLPDRVTRLHKSLRWFPTPQEIYPQEPVWYHAFNSMTEGYKSSLPYVMVVLKSRDAYFGQLLTYPIAPDTENQKDFLIKHAIFYEGGLLTEGQQLDLLDGVGAVLLNTSNVDSIKIYYHDPQEDANP